MDKIRDISINEAVLHVLDNNADEPILNNYQLDINEDSYRFILSHIERVLKDDNLRYAKFMDKKNIIKDTCQRYLDGRVNILPSSSIIAKSLFHFMNQINTIPSCDLLVVSFSTEYGPMIGILKIDYIKQYTHHIDLVDDNVGVQLTSIKTVLPDKKKIQKAAFIKPVRENQEYDLLVFDKEYLKDSDEYDKNYFVDKFLKGYLVENDRDKTKQFLNAVEIWTRSNFKNEAVKAEKLRSNIKFALNTNDEIDIYELAKKLLPFKENQENFIAYMQDRDLENIEIDKEYLEKKLSKLKIKVSSDIDLSITDDAYKDINKFEIKDNGDGSINMIIKNIENYVEK
ncbi:hypothetical protein CPAST_c40510 [Clostridium pasteurianum DSM 525 = ATCC 6013]|uniref:Nucleoid-associated protein n=1 Tax=Clostridium pasteurianum DSM 525 = ATCC 6013 TaxID=1262449 RepID=A0A0H3JBP3_CLOPA|nr:nucleoid-associated protein [Clostridium pasteurianum]AJA50080.1 hypothetical protein CPAST_c40510 [Clostridium pasteurianum DSM 525 = ATCC 6013]AJA54068.1 hypothetical protein CLPA_c40510 [Clostridium pasteurianum DSM 525 = ATCC 6013]AOZ77198.1 nucleoid-associated bacterial protein [Clostridium pasteurianum DSM 525 = ATCC 6013]AOZ80995.1 nucleoid-associated bacterial protein [Clostridium pasteurianum]ELP59219.1 hypothetical protein F502_10063 [Clostridium pasteurianum DSM 525 = ATCC 6013]